MACTMKPAWWQQRPNVTLEFIVSTFIQINVIQTSLLNALTASIVQIWKCSFKQIKTVMPLRPYNRPDARMSWSLRWSRWRRALIWLTTRRVRQTQTESSRSRLPQRDSRFSGLGKWTMPCKWSQRCPYTLYTQYSCEKSRYIGLLRKCN